MDRLQEYYKNALLADLCQDYKGRWASCHGDKEKLIKLSLCQQSIPHVVTFAHEGKGVTKEYIKENFADYINGHIVCDADGVSGYRYGLYVGYDYDNSIDVDVDVMSIMWTTGVDVVVPQSKCPTIYVSNNSNVGIVCEGYNSVTIYLIDESVITLEDVDEDSSVVIYQYSDNARVEVGDYCLSDKIRIFKKQLKL